MLTCIGRKQHSKKVQPSNSAFEGAMFRGLEQNMLQLLLASRFTDGTARNMLYQRWMHRIQRLLSVINTIRKTQLHV